jgi:hypothetical protein
MAASSFFSPELVSALVQAGPGIFQAIQGAKQTKEAEKMQQALGPRVNYAIPGSARRSLSLSEELARPRTMAGQDQMQYMIDLENAKAFGRASKAATSSQDLLGVATQLGEAGQENQLTLGMKVAQDYGARQEALGRALANMATYEDKVTADRQADWYERAKAAAAMKGAGLQNKMGALQGLTQAAVGFLGGDAAKQLFGQIGGVIGGTEGGVDKNAQVPTPSVDPLPFSIVNQPSMTNISMPTYQDVLRMGGMMGKNPSMWDYYEPIVPQNTSGYTGSNFSSGFFNSPDSDLNNPIY